MNPLVVIPSYWASSDAEIGADGVVSYDHVTSVDKPLPELEDCLTSLDSVRGIVRVAILLVADSSVQAAARARIESICKVHPRLNPVIIGEDEARLIVRVIREIVPRMTGETVSLRGYGAIKNLGLVVAAILGHDVVVFLDDDEVALDEDFLLNGVYGLTKNTRQGLKILAKSGYFVDRNDSPLAQESHIPWYNRHWSKAIGFNQVMGRALGATRISRANHAYGGCIALHAEAYSKVPFDPFITRGEDLDYLINLRLSGLEMWFDNAWRVRHMPPESPSEARRFLQDVYRWCYEEEKLKEANTRISLRRVTPESLMPYPGPWMTDEVHARIRLTAFMRALACPEHLAYLSVLCKGHREACAFAQQNKHRYLQFMSFWPIVIDSLWADQELAALLLKKSSQKQGSESEAAVTTEFAWASEEVSTGDMADASANTTFSSDTSEHRVDQGGL